MMVKKLMYQYTNIEILGLIKNGKEKSVIQKAKLELEKRNLSKEQLEKLESEYIKFKDYQEKRKHEALTLGEWITFFLLPFFVPKPIGRIYDDFSKSELERFEKYGFERKAKQAVNIQFFGYLFWFLLLTFIVIICLL